LNVDPEEVPPRFMYYYYDVLKELGVDRPIQTVAVIHFTNASITDHAALQPLSLGIADMVQVGLVNVLGITLVERERINYVLEELGFQRGDEVDPETAVRHGKQMGVRYILTGSYSRMGEQLRMTCRLVKVETGEVLNGGMIDGDADEIMELIDRVVVRAADILTSEIPLEIRKWHSERIDPEALLRYSEGLALMDYGEYGEARAKFLLAKKITPGFERAATRADQLSVVAALEEGTRTSD
jgi:TolB-like protein